MARGAQGAIITRFDADYTGMEEGAKTVVNIITEVGKKGKKASDTITASTRDVGIAVRDLGRAAGQIDPVLGKIITTLGKNRAAMAELSHTISSVGTALLAGLASPAGIVVAAIVAIGAAVAGLIYWLGRSQPEIARVDKWLLSYIDTLNTYTKALDAARIVERLHGDELKATGMKLQAASERQDLLAQQFRELTHLDIDEAIARLAKAFDTVTYKGIKFTTGLKQGEKGFITRLFGDPELGYAYGKQIATIIDEFKKLSAEIDNLSRKSAALEKEANFPVGPILPAAEINRYMADQLRMAESYRGGAMTFGADFAVQSSIEGYQQLAAQLRQVADEKQRQIDLEKELATASREAARQQMQDIQEKLDYARQYDIATIQSTQLESSKLAFQEWGVSLQATTADVYEGIMATSNMVTQGMGDAIAQAIVYQQDFGAAMAAMTKQIAASVISMLVQIGLQQLLFFAIGKTLLAAETSAKLGAQMAIGAAAAAASVFAALPFPENFVAAEIAAEAAIGLIGAQAAKGASAGQTLGAALAGAQHGAMTLGEGVLHVHSDEIIAPRSDYEHMIGKGRAGGQHTTIIELDGREVARSTAKWLPGEIHRLGIRM